MPYQGPKNGQRRHNPSLLGSPQTFSTGNKNRNGYLNPALLGAQKWAYATYPLLSREALALNAGNKSRNSHPTLAVSGVPNTQRKE